MSCRACRSYSFRLVMDLPAENTAPLRRNLTASSSRRRHLLQSSGTPATADVSFGSASSAQQAAGISTTSLGTSLSALGYGTATAQTPVLDTSTLPQSSTTGSSGSKNSNTLAIGLGVGFGKYLLLAFHKRVTRVRLTSCKCRCWCPHRRRPGRLCRLEGHSKVEGQETRRCQVAHHPGRH